jgi:HD-GYP domain-containing protein (c-di-GMP phosphodiesterase class II)
MQRHPEIGARILGGIPQLDDIIPGVLHHHESLSGHGYPHGLHGDQIPYLARVVGLADAFDAMTSGRTYRGALPLQAAMAEIRRCSGTQFCPHLADALVELVDAGLADELRVLQDGPVFQLDVLGGAGQP